MERYEMAMEKKDALEDILLELMQQMPYEQITVIHIVQRLGVSRRTFYRNFSNKDACFCALTDRLIQEMYLEIQEGYRFSKSVYLLYFAYWYKNREYLRCVMRNKLEEVFTERIGNHARTEERDFLKKISSPIADRDEDILMFYTRGIVAMLMNWTRRDFDTPVEKMAKKMVRVIHSPMIDAE